MIKIIQTKIRDRHPAREIVLLTGTTYTVGRKNCDLSFPEDQSISRTHGEVVLDHPLGNLANETLLPSICITDKGSKFGTFVNERSLAYLEPCLLGLDDSFRFGSQWNEFRIEYTPLVATSSTLSASVSKELKEVFQKLGGHLLGEWKDCCDYVIMEQTTLTIKVVCCLLAAKRLITPTYFKDLLSAIEAKKTTRPKPENYFPPVAEKHLATKSISFDPDVRRKTIFRGKLFLFESLRYTKKLGVAVRAGGGETAIITSVTQADLKNKNTIMVGTASELIEIDDSFKTAVEIYQSTSKRVIKEAEIGMAALYISMENQCNPFVDVSKVQKNHHQRIGSQTQASSSSTSASSAVLVNETQSQAQQGNQRVFYTQSQSNRSVINETVVEPRRSAGPSDSQPMQFDVLPIKTDPDAPRFDRRGRAISTPKRGTDSDVEECPSGSKRRFDSVSPSAQMAKRQRQATTPDQASSQVSVAEEAKKKNKTLAAMFGLSDDSDEDEDLPLLPPPPPTRSTRSTRSNIIPDSQPSEFQPRMTRAQRNGNAPAVNIDTSLQETQVSVVVENNEDVIPASPELFPEADSEPEPEPFRKNKPGKAEGLSKRKQPEPEEVVHYSQEPGTSTKKRRVDENVHEQKILLPDILPDVKVPMERKGDTTDKYFWSLKDEVIREENIKPLNFSFAKLLISKSERPMQPVLENIDGRPVKNFKTFRKVLPLSRNSTIPNVGVPSDLNSVANTSASSASVRSDRIFTFRSFRGPKVGEHSESIATTVEDEVKKRGRKDRQQQQFQAATPVEPTTVPAPDEAEPEEEEDEFSFVHQQRNARTTRASPRKSPRKSPTKSARVTRSSPVKLTAPVASTSTRATRSSPTKSTRGTQSTQRTAVSTRSATSDDDIMEIDVQETASMATRSTRRTRGKAAAAPPPPPVITIPEDNDEAESDDEWSFR